MEKTIWLGNKRENFDEQVNSQSVVLTNIILLICGCTSFLYRGMLYPASILAVAALLFAVSKKTLKFCLPPLILFYEYLVIPGGLSVFRVYTMLYLMIQIRKKYLPKPETRNLIFLFLVSLFLAYAYKVADLRRIVFLFIDLFAMIIYIDDIKKSNERFRYFSYSMIAAVFFACLAGIIGKSSEVSGIYLNGQWISNSRLLATFSDPNYLSLFINMAFYFALVQKSIPFGIRWPVIIGLLFFMAATGSMTGIAGAVIGFLSYLVMEKKINFRVIVGLILLMAIIVSLYSYALENDIPYVTGFAQRIQSKLQVSDNVNALTSNRTGIWREHWEYYMNQGTVRQLLGGNVINAALLDTSIFHYVSHQDYIDVLLCFGIIGFLLIMVPNVVHMVIVGLRGLRTSDEMDISIFLMKMLYFFYAFGLTMFLDAKFLLIMLI